MATPASRSLPAPAGTALPSPFRAQPPLPRSLPAGGGGSSRSWRCGELGGSWQGLTAFLLGVVSGVPPSSTLIQSPFRPPPSTPQLLQPPHNQTDSKAGWMAASSTRLKNFLVSLLSASTMLPGAPTPHPILPFFLRTAEGFLVAQMAKNLPAMQETRVDPWVRKISGEKKWQPTPGFLWGSSHGE